MDNSPEQSGDTNPWLFSIRLFVCASTLIVQIMLHTVLPCDFLLVDLTATLSIGVCIVPQPHGSI